MVPARFVSESLDARVLWDGNTESVYVITSDHESLVVEYLDVGQADSILLSSDGEYMLIDAGNNEDGDHIVSYLREVGADELKYIVGTHPHADHIGSMDDVILALDVGNVLLPDATTNTQTYTDVLDAIETKNVPVTVPVKGQTFQLGDAGVSVIAAQQADDLNNTSIVLKPMKIHRSCSWATREQKSRMPSCRRARILRAMCSRLATMGQAHPRAARSLLRFRRTPR